MAEEEEENLLIILGMVKRFAKDKMGFVDKGCKFEDTEGACVHGIEGACGKDIDTCNCHKTSTLCQCHVYLVIKEFLEVERTSLDKDSSSKFVRLFQKVIVFSAPSDQRLLLAKSVDDFLIKRETKGSHDDFSNWRKEFNESDNVISTQPKKEATAIGLKSAAFLEGTFKKHDTWSKNWKDSMAGGVGASKRDPPELMDFTTQSTGSEPMVESQEEEDQDIQTVLTNGEEDNLDLADILLTEVGRDLEKITGVCGYSLNDMKMKVSVLNEKSKLEVKNYLINEMNKRDKLKNKHFHDLVHIKIIKEIPMLIGNCYPEVTIKQGSVDWYFTLGLPFKIKKDGGCSKTVVCTCTHGMDFKDAQFTTKLDQHSYSLLNRQDRFKDSFQLGEYVGHYFNINPENEEEGVISADICMIGLPPGMEEMYYCPENSGEVFVSEIIHADNIKKHLKKPVQKLGAVSSLTSGTLLEAKVMKLFRTTLPTGKSVIVKIRGGVLIRPSPNAPGPALHEPQAPDIEPNGKPVGVGQASGPSPQGRFALNGDSGAIVTTCTEEGHSEVKAISIHLYSFKNDDGVVDSISCPIQTALDYYKNKHTVELSFEPHRLPNCPQAGNPPDSIDLSQMPLMYAQLPIASGQTTDVRA